MGNVVSRLENLNIYGDDENKIIEVILSIIHLFLTLMLSHRILKMLLLMICG